jgi:hypothetical protein
MQSPLQLLSQMVASVTFIHPVAESLSSRKLILMRGSLSERSPLGDSVDSLGGLASQR